MSNPVPSNLNHRPFSPIVHAVTLVAIEFAELYVTGEALQSTSIADSQKVPAAGIIPTHSQFSVTVSFAVSGSSSLHGIPIFAFKSGQSHIGSEMLKV